MKIKEGFVLREIDGEGVVIAVGEQSKHFNAMISLNETGVFLWRQLEKGATEAELQSAMLRTYDVDKETARQDIENFLKTAKGAGILG